MKSATLTEKKEHSNNEKISLCDVLKSNTSNVIKKAESQIPSFAQLYSDLYSEYLHSIDDLYGTCYISEKEFFDKLGIDQGILKETDRFSRTISESYISQIEMSTHFLRSYVQMRISAIKSYDSYMHVFMDSYAKMLSQFSEMQKK